MRKRKWPSVRRVLSPRLCAGDLHGQWRQQERRRRQTICVSLLGPHQPRLQRCCLHRLQTRGRTLVRPHPPKGREGHPPSLLSHCHLGAGVDPPRPSGPLRKPGELSQPPTSKGPATTVTEEPMDESGPRPDEDGRLSGSESSLSVPAGDSTGRQKDPGKKKNAPRIKIDLKP